MKKYIFILLIIPTLLACSWENRYSEPGFVRNDTIYDVQYVLNQFEREGYGFEEVAEQAEVNFCIDSALIDKNAVCPEVYEPVCGCDGVTYSNACKATSAGVLKYYKGSCKDK